VNGGYFTRLLILTIALMLGGCFSRYDYTVHKPKVIYKKPSRKALSKLLRKELGKDYVWAEEGPDEFDCSGLTYFCYGSMNMVIPRTAREQARMGKAVKVEDLKYGDLIFFDTTARKSGQITHVGVYIGNGRFEHASNEKEGVKTSRIDDPYYRGRIRICRRYLPDENDATATKNTFKTDGAIRLTKSSDTSECVKCYQVPLKATDSHGQYYIQVGSYRMEPERSLMAHLSSSGYDYRIVERDGLKKLLTGPFRDRDTALYVLPTVQRLFNPQAFVTRIEDTASSRREARESGESRYKSVTGNDGAKREREEKVDGGSIGERSVSMW
jgi:hypothetical protein